MDPLAAAEASRPPFNVVLYFGVAPVVLACLVALHLKLVWRMAIFVGYVGFLLSALHSETGEALRNYNVGLIIGFTSFFAFLELVLGDAVTEWQHESEPGPLSEKPYWKRAWWLASMTYAHRCVGWTVQVPFLPAVVHDRKTYILRKIRQILMNLLVLDLIFTYKTLDPMMALPLDQIPSLTSQPYARRAVTTFLCGTQLWHLLSVNYNVLALVTVTLGIQGPQRWPDMFGSFRDAYTIRRFWARVWHQEVRRFTGPTSKAAARALNLTPGTWLSARVQLLVGFAVSGIAHAPADYMVGPTWLGRSTPFFLWQALGITIEDYVTKMAAARGVKPAWWTYALGYLWTWPVWFTFTVPIFTGWMMQSGMGHTNLFTWSVVRPLLEWSGLDIASYVVPEMRYTH